MNPLTIAGPSSFEKSYQGFSEYPENLVRRSDYDPALLLLYKERLAEVEPDLFEDPKRLKIPVRDIKKDGSAAKRNIFHIPALKDWLGDNSQPDPNDATKRIGSIATVKDPQCRFVFLVTPIAGAPLEATREALVRLLTHHQVMPSFLDFLFVYGSENGTAETRYRGFRTESILTREYQYQTGHEQEQTLGRSGAQFQICYNLKSIGHYTASGDINSHYSRTPDLNMIIIRQATVHHQFDRVTGRQLWIVGDPRATFKGLIDEMYSNRRTHADEFGDVSECFYSSLRIHITYVRSALRDWRTFIHAFDDKVDKLTIGSAVTANVSMVRDIWTHEAKMNEASAGLESNFNTLTSLRELYRRLRPSLSEIIDQRLDIDRSAQDFESDLEEHISETHSQIDHMKYLSKLLNDRKGVLLERLQALAVDAQAQATQRQENLSKMMWQQTDRSAQETITMRIITIITLIYLPPTFVSTFFSTDIVKYQSGESYSALALGRWWSVTGPLMGITLGFAAIWFYVERRNWAKVVKQWKARNPGVLTG